MMSTDNQETRPRPHRYTKVCSISIDPELLEQLDNWAWQNRLSRSQAIAQVIERHLQEQNK